jgi:hypothetical protein
MVRNPDIYRDAEWYRGCEPAKSRLMGINSLAAWPEAFMR